MREILFRGKRVDNGEWVYGYLNQQVVGDKLDSFGEIMASGDFYISLCGCNHKVEPATVGQYTGLTDKNGVKIFEGDIVAFEDAVADYEGYHDNVFTNRAVVKYDECGWTVCGDIATVTMDDLVYKGEFDGEVIGNVSETPELLEQEE